MDTDKINQENALRHAQANADSVRAELARAKEERDAQEELVRLASEALAMTGREVEALQGERDIWQQAARDFEGGVGRLEGLLAVAKEELLVAKRNAESWRETAEQATRLLAARTAALEDARQEILRLGGDVSFVNAALADDVGEGWVPREVVEEARTTLQAVLEERDRTGKDEPVWVLDPAFDLCASTLAALKKVLGRSD